MTTAIRMINGVERIVTICPPGRAQGALPFDLVDDEGACPIDDRILDRMLREGACDDDCERTAPFIDPIDDDLEGEGSNGAEIMGFASQPRRSNYGKRPIEDLSEGFLASVDDSMFDNRRRSRREVKFVPRGENDYGFCLV